MKKTLALLLAALFLLSVLPAASAEDPILAFGEGEPDIVGKPFPDFTVSDTTKAPFTLSEVLKDHDAVVIDIFASWCGSCIRELPLLNEAYQKYKDRIAFIGLDFEPDDTILDVAEIRIGNKVRFPMSRTAGTGLNEYLGVFSVPCTLVVDRFGVLCYRHTNLFENTEELCRLLDVFVQEDYTESRVLDAIPLDPATRAYPVAGVLGIHVDNENARRIAIRHSDGYTEDAYIVPDDTARLRFDIPAEFQPADIIFVPATGDDKSWYLLSSLLDPERNAYVSEQPMNVLTEGLPWVPVHLSSRMIDREADLSLNLFPSEEALLTVLDIFRESDPDLTWEYVDQPEQSAAPAEAYLLHITDQYGSPVPGVTVNFCTDKACTALVSDENGLITFTAPAENYHVKLLKAPAGYSFDPDYELSTGAAAGEWRLVVRKD